MWRKPEDAPPRELVHAYMLAFGNEAGKIVLADLDTFVRGNMAAKKDKLDRIDTSSCIAELAARRVLERIQSLAMMAGDPNWKEIDRQRQFAAAKLKEQ
jgi:hypothetical protein